MRVPNSPDDATVRRWLGVLALVIGVPLVAAGLYVMCAGWGVISDQPDLWWLSIVIGVVGLVPAGFGAFLFFLAWVMLRGSGSDSAVK